LSTTFLQFPEVVNQGDPLIYTVPPGADQLIAIYVYITSSPTNTASIGTPQLTYTDEFGQKTIGIEHQGSSHVLPTCLTLRVKGGSTVTLEVQPTGDTVWSMYIGLIVLSAS